MRFDVVSAEISDVRFCRQDVAMNAGEVCACFSCCANFFIALNSTVTRNPNESDCGFDCGKSGEKGLDSADDGVT